MRGRAASVRGGTGLVLLNLPGRAHAQHAPARARPSACIFLRALTRFPPLARVPDPAWLQIRSASRMAAGASGSSKCCAVLANKPPEGREGGWRCGLHACMHALSVAVTSDVLQSVLDTAKEDVETVRAQLQVPPPLRNPKP